VTAPEFEPLPDALSGEPPTEHERQLLKDAWRELDNVLPPPRGVTVRELSALRAGHEAGRRSVLQAPVRVWREGDPPPESAVMLFNRFGDFSVWDPELDRSRDWPDFLHRFDPVVEVRVNYNAAVAADAARRAALEDGTL